MFGEEEAADLLQSLHRAVRKTARRTSRTRETAGPDERSHDPVTSMAAMDPERDGRGGGKEVSHVVHWRRGPTARHTCAGLWLKKGFFRLLIDAFVHVF